MIRAERRRADIQALRALAVGLVVAYHLTPGLIPGGYVGVDVFFVISGYLIIGHLVRELDESGRLRILRFWARRARRLLPAAFVVLIACATLTVAFLPEHRWQQAFTQLAASALYVQNWVLGAEAVDYLTAQAAPSLVQHFWSLSVEEQFYLGLPLVIALASTVRRSRRAILVVFLLIIVFSLSYSVYLTVVDPPAAYLSTLTRVWEFAAGGLLVFLPSAPRVVRAPLVWAGGLLILGSAFLLDDGTAFPGLIAVAPVMATAAVLIGGDVRSVQWLAHRRPVQYLGDISYSVYLWHWPVIVVVPLIVGGDAVVLDAAVIVGATLLLAAATKWLVEDRFRVPLAGRLWPTFAAAAAAAVTVVALATTGIAVSAQPTEAREASVGDLTAPCLGADALVEDCAPRSLAVSPAFASKDMFGVGGTICTGAQVGGVVGDNVECVYGDPDSDYTVALVGDSHARSLIPAVEAIALERGWRLVTLIRSSCPFNAAPLSEHGIVDEACTAWKGAAMTRILELRPDLVIAASLSAYGYELLDFSLGTPGQQVDGYASQLRVLKAAGIRTMVVGDVPYLPEAAPDCIAAQGACSYPRADVLDGHSDALARAAHDLGVPVIDLTPYLCTTSCDAVIGGLIVYQDRHHLTVTFARTLAPYVAEQVAAAR